MKLTLPPVAGGANFAAVAIAAASFVLVSYEPDAWQGRLRRILDLSPSLQDSRLLI